MPGGKARKVLHPDQQASVEELIVPSDEEVTKVLQTLGLSQTSDFNGVRLEAIEKAMYSLVEGFDAFRHETTKGAWPRVEILIDSNCLVTFTGPMDKFDKEYFMSLVQETIAGRIDLTKAQGEAMRNAPKEPMSMEVA